MYYTINPKAIEMINAYLQFNVDGKFIQSPYFINTNRRKDLRALVGKGTPEEMLMEAKIWEKLKGISFSEMSESEIKKFFQERGIGIDCSGFVAHVINYWYKSVLHKRVWSKFKVSRKGFLSRIRYSLRPVENLGAEVITSEENCFLVEVKDVMPGDLIRSKSVKLKGHHIMIVTEVERDENNIVKKITYAHSTPYFEEQNGVKYAQINILDQNLPLDEQEWLEVDKNGNKPTLEGFLMDVEDNGLRRLRFAKELE